MPRQTVHPASLTAIVACLAMVFVMWTGTGKPLNAAVDAAIGPNQITTMYLQGQGDIIVECNPVKKLLYVFERTPDNKVFFRGVRDYTYDLILTSFPAPDPKALAGNPSPGDILNYLRNKQFKNDEKWLKHKKDKKLKKKSELAKEFRTWVRGQCKDGSNATRLLTLEKESQSISRVLCLFDEANKSCIFYTFTAGRLVLVGSRNIEFDLDLGSVANDINHFFTVLPSVEQVKKAHDELKKKNQPEGE